MNRIDGFLEGVRTAAISGHINPDGDCVGSCLGMLVYLNDNYPEIDAEVCLQTPPDVFGFLKGVDRIREYPDRNKKYDLLILLDISDTGRVREGKTLISNSKKVLCLDHHRTNEGKDCDYFFNEPDSSSTCEVLYKMLDPEKVSFDCAQALYTGIVHDTGVFRYSCTSPDTMKIAGELIGKGIPFTDIIQDSFYTKSYMQNVCMGRILAGSVLLFGGSAVLGLIDRAGRGELGLSAKDLDGVVNQLSNTRGAEVTVFMYELDSGGEYKISLRSWNRVDVSAICRIFGGGGHLRAAGCTIKGNAEQVKERLLPEIEKALKEHGMA